jgi:cytochrome c
MRYRAPVIIGTACLVLASAPALAQGPGSPQRGHELAARLCSNCHVTDVGRQTGPTLADVPSFAVIANRANVTAESLAGKIIVPHPAMPGVQLTTAEIRDVVAYILSLRRQN